MPIACHGARGLNMVFTLIMERSSPWLEGGPGLSARVCVLGREMKSKNRCSSSSPGVQEVFVSSTP